MHCEHVCDMQRNSMSKRGLETLARRLIGSYPVDGWWPEGSAFEIMAGAVLVQNTRWVNADKALMTLKTAEVLESRAIAGMHIRKLAQMIRSAGCQRVKARRLQALARWIEGEDGITALANCETHHLRAGLLSVHGIGPETADAILCFAFGRPVFVADRYARRFFERYLSLEPMNYRQAQQWVHSQLPKRQTLFRDFHAAIVLHGQAVCGRQPRINCRGFKTSWRLAWNPN